MSDDLLQDLERLDARHRIHADLATPVTLQFEMVRGRTRGVLVGMETFEYLVIRLDGHIESIASRLFKGNSVVIQYVHDGTLYGFQSQTLGSVASPARLLFVSYPRIVSEQDLRAHPRIPCRLPVEVEAGGETRPAMALDLGLGGCRLAVAIEGEEPEPPTALARDASVSMSIVLPGEAEPLKITGTVKNHRPVEGGISAGVGFDEPAEDVQAALETFVKRTRSLPNWD